MKKAFSLVELLIVISIIAILTTLILYSVLNAQIKSRDAKRKSDIKAISVALEAYKAQKGRYPATCGKKDLTRNTKDFQKIDVADVGNEFGCALSEGTIKDLLVSGYIATIPLDPKQNAATGYFYYATPDGKDYKIISNNVEYLSGDCQKIAGEYYDPASPCSDYQVTSNAATTSGW